MAGSSGSGSGAGAFAVGVAVLVVAAAAAASLVFVLSHQASPPQQQQQQGQPEQQKKQQHEEQPANEKEKQEDGDGNDDDDGGDGDESLREEAVAFLKRHLPPRDRRALRDGELREQAALALAARRATPWAARVPWALFLNDVLPHRSVDEPLDAAPAAWRRAFFGRLLPLVRGAASPGDAAQLINRDVWSLFPGPDGAPLRFVADQTPEIMSVAQVLAAGYASCTGLSVFFVAACRSVGIPARVAGTPSWVADRRGAGDRYNNHCFPEVWDGAGWNFTGAAEYDARGLGRAWFYPHPASSAIPGGGMHSIFAASYAPAAGGLHFPLAWAPHDRSVHAVDRTLAYRAPPEGGGDGDDGGGDGGGDGAARGEAEVTTASGSSGGEGGEAAGGERGGEGAVAVAR